MATHVTYPGVYVREESSGAQAVASAATSTALFVGMAGKGPMDMPTRVLSQTEFERLYGTSGPGELIDQVRQFYVNGGGEAWIMRIANGAAAAAVTLNNEANAAALRLVARDKGNAGNMIRAEVDYDTGSPERTFNLTLYRHALRSDGGFDRTDVETHTNLSMDASSSRFAPNILNGASALVTAADVGAAPAATGGVSMGGAIYDAATAQAMLIAAFPAPGTFKVSIDNLPPVDVTIPVLANESDFGGAIVTAYAMQQGATVNATSGFVAFAGGSVLRIASTTGAVAITAGTTNDATVPLMLGAGAGGLEFDANSARRPAPTGITSWLGDPTTGLTAVSRFAAVSDLGAQLRNTIVSLSLLDPDDPAAPLTGWTTPAAPPIITATPANRAIVFQTATLGTLANLRAALDDMAASLGILSPTRWKARRVGLRIMLTPAYGGPQAGLNGGVRSTTYQLENANRLFRIPAPGTGASNVASYSLGRLGGIAPVGRQTNASPADVGFDGNEPVLGDYNTAFNTIRSELDSFNFLILPRASGQDDAERKGLWGAASALAAERRAILFVDPDENWPTIAAAEAGVAALKVGVETRNAVIYWPRLRIPAEGVTAGKPVDPSGSIAGLMARTDERFGVWTAPAGIEATIRGIVGIQKNISDDENGVLNPKALNAIRLFPSGAVAWGARTMIGSDDTGNIDDKYIPVRRTMLFIEESLYRGLKWAVFEPNDVALWRQIRLNAGVFMHDLFRKGAFQGTTPSEAYFVKVDAETTTQNDRNLGIVNVWIGFAPLKPAEFVVLYLQQIAGQLET